MGIECRGNCSINLKRAGVKVTRSPAKIAEDRRKALRSKSARAQQPARRKNQRELLGEAVVRRVVRNHINQQVTAKVRRELRWKLYVALRRKLHRENGTWRFGNRSYQDHDVRRMFKI